MSTAIHAVAIYLIAGLAAYMAYRGQEVPLVAPRS